MTTAYGNIMIKKLTSKTAVGYSIQMVSILFNALSILLNKFLLMHLPVFVVVIGNLFFSLLICLLYYKNIKQYLYMFKVCLPVSLINLVGIVSLYYSNSVLSPITLGILSRFYLIFAFLLSIYLLKEQFNNKQLILILFSIFGCICFVFRRNNIGQISIFNVLTCLLSSFCFALGYSITKMLSTKSDPKIMFFYNNFIGLLSMCLYFIFIDSKFICPTAFDCMLLFSSAMCFFISIISFFKGLKFLSFGEANALRSLSPIVLSIISFPFFPEKLSSLNIIGFLIIIFSLFNLGESSEAKRKI